MTVVSKSNLVSTEFITGMSYDEEKLTVFSCT